jgi:hypothetical protein
MPGQPGAEKARSEADGWSGSLQPAHLLQPSPLGGQEKAIAVGQVHSGLYFTTGRPGESHSGWPGPFRPSLACLIDLALTYLLTQPSLLGRHEKALVAAVVPCNVQRSTTSYSR